MKTIIKKKKTRLANGKIIQKEYPPKQFKPEQRSYMDMSLVFAKLEPSQAYNKAQSYINDQDIRNANQNKVHPYETVMNCCEGSTNLYVSVSKRKNYSVHDIPNENGKKKIKVMIVERRV